MIGWTRLAQLQAAFCEAAEEQEPIAPIGSRQESSGSQGREWNGRDGTFEFTSP